MYFMLGLAGGGHMGNICVSIRTAYQIIANLRGAAKFSRQKLGFYANQNVNSGKTMCRGDRSEPRRNFFPIFKAYFYVFLNKFSVLIWKNF